MIGFLHAVQVRLVSFLGFVVTMLVVSMVMCPPYWLFVSAIIHRPSSVERARKNPERISGRDWWRLTPEGWRATMSRMSKQKSRPAAGAPGAGVTFPDRKISETLLDFAQPLIAIIDENATEKQIRDGFMIAVTVWNAHVMDKVRGNREFMSKIEGQIGDLMNTLPVVRSLIARKQEQFADDLRMVGNHTVSWKDGALRVWAEARSPYPAEKAGEGDGGEI